MNSKRQNTKTTWMIFGSMVICVVTYLAFSASYYRIGFPLDDAWIHQTYARNLIEYGRWVYIPNTLSGGSTAPLWTVLLSLGYLLSVPAKLWAYILGGISFFATAFISVRWYQGKKGQNGLPSLMLGLLILFEWHIAWAAVSGMETILMGAIAVLLFKLIESRSDRYWSAGILIGLGFWIRPDSILLLLPSVWYLFFLSFQEDDFKRGMISFLQLVAGVVALAGPYLVFNFLTAGSIWPTTFFAKQAEYAALLEQPLLTRAFSMLKAPLAGVGVLLLPAFLFHAYDLIRNRRYAELAPFVWIAGYFGAYVLRLPVSYQHGRYLIPILPVSLVLGYFGFSKLVGSISVRPSLRILQRVWILTVSVVVVLFWIIGGRAYAQDVAIIESEMVATARWIHENTPIGAKIAVHDIGAFGYYAERDLLDLAGLVTPDVIPIIRDEQALEMLMDREGVDYLMTFPDWYPYLTKVGEKLYQTDARFSPAQGGENMAVYRWP
jgi:hypothetical protein